MVKTITIKDEVYKELLRLKREGKSLAIYYLNFWSVKELI